MAAKRMGIRGLFGSSGTLPPLAPDVLSDLTREYRDDMARLEEMLGRKLSVWYEPPDVNGSDSG